MELEAKNNGYRVVALSTLQDVNAWENGQKTDKVVNKTFDCAALSDSMKDLIKGTKDVIWATISWENGRKWFNFIIDRFYFQYFH